DRARPRPLPPGRCDYLRPVRIACAHFSGGADPPTLVCEEHLTVTTLPRARPRCRQTVRLEVELLEGRQLLDHAANFCAPAAPGQPPAVTGAPPRTSNPALLSLSPRQGRKWAAHPRRCARRRRADPGRPRVRRRAAAGRPAPGRTGGPAATAAPRSGGSGTRPKR